MECLLMRHGIAVEREEWSGLDETRPLTDEGRKKVGQVARGLSAMGIAPTHLYASPLTRAQETAEVIQSKLCPDLAVMICEALKPGSPPSRLVRFLQKLPNHSVVFCVGHEPLLGAIAGYLISGKPAENFPMKKAGVALIHTPSIVRAGEGLLRWWCTPAQLKALGQAQNTND